MKVWHIKDGEKREVESQGVNYDADVMVRYIDTDDIAIVPKAELRTE